MSLSVSYNQINSGIDTAALKEVTSQIFQRANSQNSVLAKADLTKFNRVTLGTDLYGSKVNASTASQIALAKSGAQINLNETTINCLKYLNAQASKSIFNAVDGKVALPEVKTTTEKSNVAKLSTFGHLVKTADLDSNKEGSNPFYRGELLNAGKKDAKKEESLNIFA